MATDADRDMDELLLSNISNATPARSDYVAGAGRPAPVDSWTAIVSVVHLLICVSGIVGNACVIVVIARYAKAKTVTNFYIANLAVADLCFLVGLPFLVAVSRWICVLGSAAARSRHCGRADLLHDVSFGIPLSVSNSYH